MENKPSQCKYPNCNCEHAPWGAPLCKREPAIPVKEQQPAEGEKLDYGVIITNVSKSQLTLPAGFKGIVYVGVPVPSHPTAVGEEELEREAEEYADEHYLLHTDSAWKAAKDAYLAAAKRYTRQGGEDWEALYISEHLNLLAAKGRIAQLEQQWISVEERLPEKAGCYIVYEKETNIETLYFTGTHFQNAFEEVTHWQRLPSPPNTKQVI